MENFDGWRFNEFEQTGKDYGQQEEVDEYDSDHNQFRDLEEQAHEALTALDLDDESKIIDFGTGTGTFPIVASNEGHQVTAVDVSEHMLNVARKKAQESGIDDIDFVQDGFLTYDVSPPFYDAAVTSYALHHLPNFWKSIALKRLNNLLVEDGTLFVRDVVLKKENPVEQI